MLHMHWSQVKVSQHVCLFCCSLIHKIRRKNILLHCPMPSKQRNQKHPQQKAILIFSFTRTGAGNADMELSDCWALAHVCTLDGGNTFHVLTW